MHVIRAAEMGMCFGVRDALAATRDVPDPANVTIHGELVHNPTVARQLEAAGFRQSPEGSRHAGVSTPVVLITAHGVSQAERRRLASAGKTLIDTTCPLVRRAHDAAQALASDGRHVLVIGKAGHVEVRGIVEDLEHFDVVDTAGDVRTYAAERLGVVCQTTMPPAVVEELMTHIRTRNTHADIRMIDTVCRPTRLRQASILELVERVDAVVVVGGRNSNNTRWLVRVCEERHTPALHVESAADLEPDWFSGFHTIGLTAGTSTLDKTIDDVQHALEHMGAPAGAAGAAVR